MDENIEIFTLVVIAVLVFVTGSGNKILQLMWSIIKYHDYFPI